MVTSTLDIFMKRLLILIIIGGYILVSCRTTHKPAPAVASSQVLKTKLDTVIRDRYDTLINKQSYEFNYVKNPEIASFFKPYFIENICEPGNTSHPIYQDFITQGQALKPEVMAKFEARLQGDPATRILMEQHLDDLKLLKTCTLTQIPAYYLSVNAVEYTKDASIKQYFHLNTKYYLYSVLKDGKSIATISYEPGSSCQVYGEHRNYTYNRLIELGTTPIILETGVTILRKGVAQSPFGAFGFIKDGHLIWANCSQGERTIVYASGPQSGTKKDVFVKVCAMSVVDTFFTNGSLNSALESYYKFFKEYGNGGQVITH
jgi:hypothetical protein